MPRLAVFFTVRSFNRDETSTEVASSFLRLPLARFDNRRRSKASLTAEEQSYRASSYVAIRVRKRQSRLWGKGE